MERMIKIVESPREVYFAKTIQFKALVDGEEMLFRHYEDSNGAESFQLTDSGWGPIEEKFEWISDLILEAVITEDTEIGDEFTEDDLDF